MKLVERIADLPGLVRRHPLWATVMALIGAVGIYDSISGSVAQVTDWSPPSIRALFGWSVETGSHLLPWWGWLLVLLVLLNVALVLDRWMGSAPAAITQNVTAETTPETNHFYPPTVTQDSLSPAIHLASIHPELGHLDERNVLRLALLCFNGSGRPMRFRSSTGTIQFGPWPPESGLTTLPMPHVMFEESQPVTPAFGQFFVFIEISVPHQTAHEMSRLLGALGFELDFTGLAITLHPDDASETTARLHLWESARIARQPDYIGAWRNHRVSVNVSLSASGSAG